MKSNLNHADYLLGWDAPGEGIKAELVEHRYKSTRRSVIFANVVVAGVVTAAMWEMKPHALLLGWLAVITAVALLLVWSMAYYASNKSRHPAQTWAFRFMLGAFVNGVAWGGGALLLFDTAITDGNILMVGVICGMTAGNVVTSFAIPGTTYAYLVPAILLSMLMPLTQGSFSEHTLALLWIPYLIIMVILTRTAHKGLAQSIKLSYENTRLAENLAVAKERAEQLARAKSDFLAVMSHEIRTPMHGMLGIAELLSSTNLDPKQKDYLDHLRGAGEYLSQLLNNILDFSKIDAGKLVLNEITFSLSELVGEVASMFALQATRKGLVLDVIFPDNIPAFWCGDAYRLKQILINLLGNAVKFTDHGIITLEITMGDSDQGKTWFSFRVSDTGPGISSQLTTAIFDPFTQENPAISRDHGGTGLGLAISKRLVEAMGGTLAVETRVGHGSSFSYSLPLLPAGDASAIPADEQEMADSHGLPPARILLADDSPFNRLVVREFLRDTTCTIDEAENGQEAMQMFQHSSYDIVLMDMRMPVMDGLETVRRIRYWEASQQRQPSLIIMLTASVFASERVAVLAAGCNEVLTKPVQKGTLIRMLRNMRARTAAW